jgi:hypothetical protein
MNYIFKLVKQKIFIFLGFRSLEDKPLEYIIKTFIILVRTICKSKGNKGRIGYEYRNLIGLREKMKSDLDSET